MSVSSLRRAAVLALLPLLSSCSSRGVTELRGQVHGWTGGMGRVELLDDNLHTIVSAPLDPAGRFNLKLPTEQELGSNVQPSLVPDLPASCKSTVQSTPAHYYTIGDLSAFPAQGSKVAYTLHNQTWNADHTKLDKRVLIFASQNAQVRGDLSCQGSVISYRLSLRPGWNYAMSRQSAGGNATIENVSSKDGFESWAVAQ